MVEPTPPSPFKVTKSHLLLELEIGGFDAPAQLGVIDQPMKADIFRERSKPVLSRVLFALRPLDEQPFFWPAFAEPVVTVSDAHAHACKT
jgi:hypothetical protein